MSLVFPFLSSLFSKEEYSDDEGGARGVPGQNSKKGKKKTLPAKKEEEVSSSQTIFVVPPGKKRIFSIYRMSEATETVLDSSTIWKFPELI